jgi:hypothetical protein
MHAHNSIPDNNAHIQSMNLLVALYVRIRYIAIL